MLGIFVNAARFCCCFARPSSPNPPPPVALALSIALFVNCAFISPALCNALRNSSLSSSKDSFSFANSNNASRTFKQCFSTDAILVFASDSFARTRAISSSFLLKLALASSFTSSMAFPNATLNASTRFAIPFSVSNRCCFNSTFNFFTAKAISALRSLTAAFAFLHSSSTLLIWSFLFSFSLVSCSFSLVSFPSFASLSLLSFSHFRSFSSNAFKHFSRSFSTSNRRSMCLLISSSASLRSPLNATAASSSARSARSARLDSFARNSLSLRNSACTSEVLCSIVNCRIRLSVSSFTEYSSDCVSFTTNSSASRFDSNVFVFSFVLSNASF